MDLSFLVPLLFSLVPMLGWGALGVLVAKVARSVGGLNAGFLIQGSAFLLTLLIWPLFFSVPQNINWQMLIFLSAVGAAAYASYCHALKVGKVTVVVPVTSAWAVITAAMGIVFLKETVSVLKVLSITAVVCGLAGLTVNWRELTKISPSALSAGIIPALFTAAGWGVSYYFLGPLTREMGWFFTTLGNRLFVAVFLSFLFLRQTGTEKARLRNVPWKILAAVAVLDVVATTGYNLAVSRYEVSYVSVISSASPLVSVILASVLMKDRTDIIQKAGIFLIIAGIIGLQV